MILVYAVCIFEYLFMQYAFFVICYMHFFDYAVCMTVEESRVLQ